MKWLLVSVGVIVLAAGIARSGPSADRKVVTAAQPGVTVAGKNDGKSTTKEKSSQKSDDLAQAHSLNQAIDEHTVKVDLAREGLTGTANISAPMLDQIRVVSELESLAALRPVIAELRERSRAILEKKTEFEVSLKALRSDLAAAPQVFRKAAAVYRTYAEAEPYKDIKEDYLMLASTWDRLADAVKENETQVDSEATEVTDLLNYLMRIDLFLQRLDQHLASFPTTSGTGQWNEHLAELKEYAKKFEDLRSSLNGIHKRVKDSAESPAATKSTEASATSSPRTLYRYQITPMDDGRSRITLPRVNALGPGDKVAVFRESHRLAGWATIEIADKSAPVAIAKTDVAPATGDYVALWTDTKP